MHSTAPLSRKKSCAATKFDEKWHNGMRKIGFIDYYLSEWHANNYPAWIKTANETLGTDYEVAYGWAELDASPLDGVTTAEWCEKFGATPCATLEELCEKSDMLLILAPSDPEKHLPYARVALTYGKPTYIDKTFAPNLAEAEEMFAIAKAHSTPFFSSSALRYATELDSVSGCVRMMTTGSGRSADEYIVHQTEMVVKKLGIGANRVRAEKFGTQTLFRVEYANGKKATMLFAPSVPFTVYLSECGDTKPVYKQVTSKYFDGLIADMVRFFEEGTVSFNTAETLEIMKIREGAIKAIDADGQWIDLETL